MSRNLIWRPRVVPSGSPTAERGGDSLEVHLRRGLAVDKSRRVVEAKILDDNLC